MLANIKKINILNVIPVLTFAKFNSSTKVASDIIDIKNTVEINRYLIDFLIDKYLVFLIS